MSTYYWSTNSSSSTWTTNQVPKSVKDELEPLKKSIRGSLTNKKEVEVEPILFDPKDLVL